MKDYRINRNKKKFKARDVLANSGNVSMKKLLKVSKMLEIETISFKNQNMFAMKNLEFKSVLEPMFQLSLSVYICRSFGKNSSHLVFASMFVEQYCPIWLELSLGNTSHLRLYQQGERIHGQAKLMSQPSPWQIF